MTRKALTYILLLFLVAACGNKETAQYTIKGKVGKEQGKMLIYGLDNRFERVDSVIANENGKFSYTIEADTIFPLALLIPGNDPIVLYAEPNVKARLTYDSITEKRWIVEGGGPAQLLHDSISNILDACKSEKARRDSIESFVKRFPISDINIEIFRRYLIETPNPDNSQIKAFISKLGGILQDHEYFATIKKSIDKRNSNTLHKLFPSFTYTTDSNKQVKLSTFNKKHLLVTFWAPWDEASRREMRLLRDIDNFVKSKNFEILNIALEYDTVQWKKVLECDSIAGHNVCETNAWSSEIANKFNIRALPFSVLVSPYQRIINFDLKLKDAGHLIDSLATKYDKDQEERDKKKRERERKEQEKEKQKKPAKRR